MEDEQFKKNLAYPFENFQVMRTIYGSLNLNREGFYSTLKQFTPINKEMERTEIIFTKYSFTNGKKQRCCS